MHLCNIYPVMPAFLAIFMTTGLLDFSRRVLG
jgi:hypothetical protein